MIIREYEYEKNRPWNCQERFIKIDCDDAWNVYKNMLFGNTQNERLNMIDRIILGTVREDKNLNALSFEFKIKDGIFIHTSSEWDRHNPFNKESIIITMDQEDLI